MRPGFYGVDTAFYLVAEVILFVDTTACVILFMPKVFFGVDTGLSSVDFVLWGDDDFFVAAEPNVGLTKGLRFGVEDVPEERPIEVPGRDGVGLDVVELVAVDGLADVYPVVLVAGAFLIDSSKRPCNAFTSSLTLTIWAATCSLTYVSTCYLIKSYIASLI